MQNSDLQQSQDPQLPDLKAAEGGSRQQHTDLVQRLVPEHTHSHGAPACSFKQCKSITVTLCDVN